MHLLDGVQRSLTDTRCRIFVCPGKQEALVCLQLIHSRNKMSPVSKVQFVAGYLDTKVHRNATPLYNPHGGKKLHLIVGKKYSKYFALLAHRMKITLKNRKVKFDLFVLRR